MKKEDLEIDLLDFWLLDIVATDVQPVSILGMNQRQLQAHLNRQCPAFSYIDASQRIVRLLDDGLIFFANNNNGGRVKDNSSILDEIANGDAIWSLTDSVPSYQFCYGLTRQGGRYWENACRCKWEYYVPIEMEPFESRRHSGHGETLVHVRLRGIERDRVLQRFCHVVTDGMAPIAATMRWRTLRNWKITYWKSMARGVLLAFDAADVLDLSRSTSANWARFEAWYDVPRMYRL